MACEVIPLRIPLDGPGGISAQGRETYYECALLVLREDGLYGLGEAPALRARGASLEVLCRELEAGRPCHPAARSAWASAELDLAARRKGVQAVELLGGARRRSVPCNALVGAASPAATGREVEAARSAGYGTVKLKAAGLPLDYERLGASRWAAGGSGRLRLDCNGADYRPALRTLEALGLELIEQPLPAGATPALWQATQSGTALMLAADESLADPALAAAVARTGIALACKLATVGGPRAALELAAQATGPVLLSSSYETSVGIAAALATACALPRDPLACGLATRRLLEADIAHGLGAEGPELGLPAGPGLGVELDERAVARYRVDR
jgi:L-Ala-D/L-Glu epimerase